jgi:hypothetical protein
MKRSYCSIILFGIVLILSGCTSSESTITPVSTQTSQPSSAPKTSTVTLTRSPTAMVTHTPLPTLNPIKSREILMTLLQKPIDCAAPCFWGIMPGQSTLNEALQIFAHFDLQTKSTTLDNKEFYGVKYDFDKNLSMLVTLTIKDKVVENLRVFIHPEKQKAGVQREWLAYSPQTLINRYGLPSKVDFFLDRGESPSYGMVMYFDSAHLLASYDSYDLGTQLQVCPLTNQIDPVRIWMGQEPQYPPYEGVPLEKATSMTIEEFSKLMTGNPSKACLTLNGEAFP